MLTRTIAVEHKDVIAVAQSPGWVLTDMGGKGGRVPPLTAEQSCRMILRSIYRLKPEDTGAFLRVTGEVMEF